MEILHPKNRLSYHGAKFLSNHLHISANFKGTGLYVNQQLING